MSQEKTKLIRIFEYALNQEKTGLSFFNTSLERMDSASAKSAFKILVEEEKKHIQYIGNILKDLRESGEIIPLSLKKVEIMPTNFFEDREKSEFLERCISESMIPDVTVFNTAWLIEKDLSNFYASMINEVTEERAKEAFQQLSNWEKEHELFFREFRDKLTSEYATMPWGG
ncbi:ferritin family protein [Candidatus Riflebacteria bacterium]